MNVHALHPIDRVLAEIGLIARRAKTGTLTGEEFRFAEPRIRQGLSDTGADPGGVVGALLDGMVLCADAGTLDHATVLRVTARMRDRLCRVRDGSLPVVANFAVLPHGVHGRPYGRLTAIDGGRSPEPKGH